MINIIKDRDTFFFILFSSIIIPIPYSLFTIPDSRFPIPDSRFPIPDSRLLEKV
ncbi:MULTISPECIES: hypothetical protein [unclassified Moorena]|uniref:hypothetical protein n=1 Tax=unclassified Moorena TaxID=2683338 RepID=UPI0013B733EF|nr:MULTISPECIES: hypothetical protein [unclassified Moorena]NEP30623.1 hypothetical protein [Moorena sp. SIO3B2]NEQ07245.1 hypothetical protein [Moorena sp. SIO4E2]